MIDWITARIPLAHTPLDCDKVLRLNKSTGEILWQAECWSDVVSSHDSSIRLRSSGPDLLDFSGNPTKFLQDHNLFGIDDLTGLLTETILRVFPLVGRQVDDPSAVAAAVRQARGSRIDVNYSYALSSRSQVRAWIRAAENAAYLKHRGRGTLTRESTLYFGKHSRRWSLKIYSKGDEIEAHPIPVMDFQDSLIKWADDKLRVEIVLRGLALRDLNLAILGNWTDNTATEIFQSFISDLQLTDQLMLPATDLDALPPRLRSAYQNWLDGHDLRTMFPKSTFYHYRNQLLGKGVDIAIKQHRDPSRDVVQLGSVLHAKPAGIPDWAYGTPALFKPRYHHAA